MISNRCARKYLVTNCNSIISKNYLRFLVDSNELSHYYIETINFTSLIRFSTLSNHTIYATSGQANKIIPLNIDYLSPENYETTSENRTY